MHIQIQSRLEANQITTAIVATLASAALTLLPATAVAQQAQAAPCSPSITGASSPSGTVQLTTLSQENCIEQAAQEEPRPSNAALTGLLAKVITHADQYIAKKDDWISNPKPGGRVSAVEGYIRKPAMEGLTDLYKATNNSDYLDLAITLAHEYINTGSDETGDGYLDWYSDSKNGYDHSHYEWRAAAGIGYLLTELSDSKHANQYDNEVAKFTNYLAISVWEKWEPTGPLANIDNHSTTATYFIGRLGLTAIALHKTTGADTYLEWLDNQGGELIRSLKNQYRPEFDAYNLTGRVNGDDVSQSNTPGTVDTSHAADAFSFLSHAKLEGYDLGGEYDDVVLDRIINTLTNVMFTDTHFSENVDGTGGIGTERSNSNGGYARFATFENDLLERYVRYATAESTYASGAISYEARIHTLGSLAYAITKSQ